MNLEWVERKHEERKHEEGKHEERKQIKKEQCQNIAKNINTVNK
jgi:hypothetical protein